MSAPWPVHNEELKAKHCWFDVDRVAKQPEITAFKRRARWQQAWWRERENLPLGGHLPPGKKNGPRKSWVANGSRIELEAARAHRGNFLSPSIRTAVSERLSHPEPHETLNEDRLLSDLLSSMPMCFNLFAESKGDRERARAASDTIWPDHPGTADSICFEWSPGRKDRKYLGNRSAFDAAFLFGLPHHQRGIVGIETKYHEHMKPEKRPNEKTRLHRYREVTDRSHAFVAGWEHDILGKDLQQIWLDHLLVLSMLQHPSGDWQWDRFVFVYPAANPSAAAAANRYRDLLTDDSTFEARTIEELLDTHTLQTRRTEARFRERYLW